MNKKLIRLTESDLHRIVKETANRVLNEISDATKQSYINGRRQQGRGNRPLSNTMIKKGEKDLAKYKAMGYPCGGAQNGEEFAKMDADTKAIQTYMDGRGKYSWGA